ncbi:MAG: DSD1 family PLP-dependent enzyme [Rhodospirillaceae bacterium]|nr:DSD1 family PLP-dependent enzyme [Rhodospirillaceae bacterium]
MSEKGGNEMSEIRRLPINADLVGVPGGARQVTTPALMIDRAAMRRNFAAMKERCAAAGMKLRPHGKTHKCSALAREQLAAGAVGICAATAHEAIAFARAGITGILVTAPVVQPRHLAAIAELHKQGADITVVIDHPDAVGAWQRALGNVARPLPVLVDVDLGMGRTGVPGPDAAVAVARRLGDAGVLAFSGVQAYSGRVQHIESYEERRATYLAQIKRLDAAVSALKAAGFDPPTVSGGGTGTFGIDTEHRLYTESQAGSYLFMDVEYNAVELFRGAANPYGVSLYLRTSVVSNNVPGQATINAGFKAFATDGPVPQLFGNAFPGARYEFFGDEYGRLILPEGAAMPAIGTPVDLVTPHCDPTVNLHDFYHVVEGDTVVAIWPIDARGVA